MKTKQTRIFTTEESKIAARHASGNAKKLASTARSGGAHPDRSKYTRKTKHRNRY